jgi:Ca-activated chloride channel homolog
MNLPITGGGTCRPSPENGLQGSTQRGLGAREAIMSLMSRLQRSKRRAVILAAPLLALGACLCGFGAKTQEQGSGGIRVNVSLVMLDATVKNKAGQIMADLKKEDFEVREDGAVQKVALFGRDELPLHVALVVDLSDSIGPFFGPLREAATTTLAALKPDDDVALFTFSTEAVLRVPLTQDKGKIAEQFGTFHAGGATNINDGIFVAAEYLLKTAPKGRRVIILISDDVATDAGDRKSVV